MKLKNLFLLASVLFITITSPACLGQNKINVQDDPVLVPDVFPIPVINANGDDPCWQNIKWQSIDQVWIPYNGSVTTEDYTGHYKIAWSSTENLLYFLIEVTDDQFVDGFINGRTADIYNYDIAEVFIDENHSGGLHMIDGNGQNAENAFAYHIYSPFPDSGVVTTELYVDDQATNNRPNNASHLPEFTHTRAGNKSVWEFSLIVYNDTYTPTTKDAARVHLTADKLMGLSVAYCDNDGVNENPKVRDNMFGSVWEPSPGNLHWQNADYFGHVKLVSSLDDVAQEESIVSKPIKLYPNPASSSSNIQLDDPYRGDVSFRLFNIIGQEVYHTSAYKAGRFFTHNFNVSDLPNGLYLYQVQLGNKLLSEKLVINKK